jgi:hypothetical protein
MLYLSRNYTLSVVDVQNFVTYVMINIQKLLSSQCVLRGTIAQRKQRSGDLILPLTRRSD